MDLWTLHGMNTNLTVTCILLDKVIEDHNVNDLQEERFSCERSIISNMAFSVPVPRHSKVLEISTRCFMRKMTPVSQLCVITIIGLISGKELIPDEHIEILQEETWAIIGGLFLLCIFLCSGKCPR